jgi:hypothetical protein
MWDEGARWDAILLRLRADCIRATVELLRLPLAGAKRLVHDSRAWADRRVADDQFHQSFLAWLDDAQTGEPLDLPVTAAETLAEARAADEV